MKICDLTQFYSPLSGGVRRYIQEKAVFTREHRPDCQHVLIIPGEKTACLEEKQSRVYTIRSPLVSRTSRYRMLLNLGAVERIIEREKPDVIESGDPYQTAWKALATGAALRIPVVGFYHSHFPEAYLRSACKYFGNSAQEAVMDAARRYVRQLYRRFSRTLVPSAGLEQVLADWGVDNTELIELGVNTTLFHPADPPAGFREKSGIPEEAILLLYVGRLAPEKNVKTLFTAFEQLHFAQPGRFHLLVIGDGAARENLEHLQSSTGAITWRPWCGDASELAAFYRAADLFVHPGVQETFGLVTLESQACGTPVVGIRGSYMDRIIFNDQAHWAAANTPSSLAGAIEAAAALDLRALGLAASERVCARYDWRNVFQKLFAVYESL